MEKELLEQCKEYLVTEENIIFAYVFGSYARGEWTSLSDIDFAIYWTGKDISPSTYLNLKRTLMDICKTEVDLVLLNDASPLVKKEIFAEGIRLFSRNEVLESNFIVHSIFEYEDMKKYYELSYKTMIEYIRKEVDSGGKG
ncbi:type VII toxin-antitoxin system MntA family adenylyltransferase antitoxin [Thermotalea metallivorans]|uniref:Polymerase beta nucleotidyltransferase domain-containing protein n=1 Tax=Thermotalea metallivorans TaxID=520762 RepID=A0A140L6Y4_9FIRM|nr:nucleotidyltransferase domain-containing protein [Thermotalea metallivorans]KXG76309.1 hypothetical protein AN619_12660 [Thermotalea metallivorans]